MIVILIFFLKFNAFGKSQSQSKGILKNANYSYGAVRFLYGVQLELFEFCLVFVVNFKV